MSQLVACAGHYTDQGVFLLTSWIYTNVTSSTASRVQGSPRVRIPPCMDPAVYGSRRAWIPRARIPLLCTQVDQIRAANSTVSFLFYTQTIGGWETFRFALIEQGAAGRTL
jgi:hypothetical protein